MTKYKTRHYETLKAGLFPRAFPQCKMVGKQKDKEPQLGHDPEPQTLDEIWEWHGNPDEY